MERAEALSLLASESAVDRLRAARALIRLAQPADRQAIEAALRDESDAWIRSALAQLIADDVNGDAHPADEAHLIEDPEQLKRDVRAYTTQQLTAAIQHELQPILGSLKQSSQDEGIDLESSPLGLAIRRLESFLEAMRSLHDASGVASRRQFDLSDLVAEVDDSVREERRLRADTAIGVVLAGSDPVVVTGDPDLVRLALANVLRNALEASDPRHGGAGKAVVVNWGVTDRDAWVAVIDSGVGLPLGASGMLKPGTTTKDKSEHRGMGLAVAALAIENLNGSISHKPRKEGGVACEVRWQTGNGA